MIETIITIVFAAIVAPVIAIAVALWIMTH